jgi:hypothetical protein
MSHLKEAVFGGIELHIPVNFGKSGNSRVDYFIQSYDLLH